MRAYQDSVRQNLESLVLCERVPQIRLMVTVDYACLDALRRLLPVHEVSIVDEDYAVAASLTLRLPEEQESAFCAALAGVSNGAAICVRTVDAAD